MAMKKTRMKVVVSRKKWTRGGREDTALKIEPGYSGAGKMCCLGFACQQLGIRPKTFLGLGAPEEIFLMSASPSKREITLLQASPLVTKTGNSKLTMRAIVINDTDSIDDRTREKKLTALFKKHRQQIVFVP